MQGQVAVVRVVERTGGPQHLGDAKGEQLEPPTQARRLVRVRVDTGPRWFGPEPVSPTSGPRVQFSASSTSATRRMSRLKAVDDAAGAVSRWEKRLPSEGVSISRTRSVLGWQMTAMVGFLYEGAARVNRRV